MSHDDVIASLVLAKETMTEYIGDNQEGSMDWLYPALRKIDDAIDLASWSNRLMRRS